MSIRRLSLFLAFAFVVAACGDIQSNEPVSELETISGIESALSSSKRRRRAKTIRNVAARRGLKQGWLLAGIADAETHLTHCWSEATWACQGPRSSSCGGGPVIAGAGDGPCYLHEGGLGMFQFDAGTFRDTIRREGRGVLSLSGNISRGVDFVIGMVIRSNYIRNVSNKRQALNWMNKVTRPTGTRFHNWIRTVTHYYNGCAPWYSCWNERYSRYRSYARGMYREMGANFWRISSYDARFRVRLAPKRSNFLKDGRSRKTRDVPENHRLTGIIQIDNRSDRRLKKVRVRYRFPRRLLDAETYEIQYKRRGQKKWATARWLYREASNPGRHRLDNRGTLYLGNLRKGEKRRIVIRFRATTPSIRYKNHARLSAWVTRIEDVYGYAKHYGSKPVRNKLRDNRRLRDRVSVDIVSGDEWLFQGLGKGDREGWRRCFKRHVKPLEIGYRNRRTHALVVRATGRNSCVRSPKWTKINANRYDQMVIRLKSWHGPHQVALWWKTREGQPWHASRRIRFAARGAGNYHTIVVPVGEHRNWSDVIRRIRIDPLEREEPVREGQLFIIDKVFFQSSTTHKTSSDYEDYVVRTPAETDIGQF
jgi:hypothetical protein